MKKIFGLVGLLLTIYTTSAQNAPSSPEQHRITSMVDFTEFPTGSATGIPDVKLPLFQTGTRGEMKVDLTLQYNLMGSQNADMLGSQFGDAWNLSFLGVISREVKRRNPGAPSVKYRVPDENFFANSGANPEDTFPDVYTYNILGYEGKFSLSKVNNEIVPILLENNDYVSVAIDYDSNGVDGPVFNSLTIKDKKGNSYIFENTGIYDNNKFYYSYIPPNDSIVWPGAPDLSDPNPFDPDNPYEVRESNGPPYIKSWHLSKVLDKYGNSLFTMEYETTSVNFAQVNYLKKINITNKGSVLFNNHIQPNLYTLVDNYTTNITIKNLLGRTIKSFDFQYSQRHLSMNNGNDSFRKLYLTRIKQYDRNQNQSEDYEIKYKSGVASSANALLKNGFVSFKKCYTDYDTFNDIATYMTLQKIKYPTGGSILYQFESNTYEGTSSMYQSNNIFNKEHLLVSAFLNSGTLEYSFNIPQGYDRVYTKSYGSSNYTLWKADQYLGSLSGTQGPAQLDDYCNTSKPGLKMVDLQGNSGTFHIKGVTSPYMAPSVIQVLAIRDKEEHEMEKFVYGYGSRIKRIAYFSSDIADDYLENTPVATTADKEIHFDYSEEGDSKRTSGRYNYFTHLPDNDPMKDKIIYEKVTTTINDMGKTEAYYDNVTTMDSHWHLKNLLPRELITYNDNNTLSSKKIFDRTYTVVGELPVVSKEIVNSKAYEGTSYTEQINEVNYDLTHRYPVEIISTLPAINETKRQVEVYTQQGDVYTKSSSESFFNGNTTASASYHYNNDADLLYTETAKATLPLEINGNEITRITDGRVEEYKLPDGTYVSQIWGYHNTQIVAQLKNLRYAEIATNVFSNIGLWSSTLSYNEATLKNTLNSLRSAHPDALITTYIYIPMVGMKSSTDANGRTETYQYDDYNRLHKILDHEGNVMKEYNYNIKN